MFSHDKTYLEKLVKCAMLSLTLAGGSDCGASVSSAIVGWYLQRGGMKKARKIYKRYMQIAVLKWKFFMSKS